MASNMDFSELESLLKSYDTDKQPETIEFGQGQRVETEFFTMTVPAGYTVDYNMADFTVACYLTDFQTTPLQVTVKAEPLVLLSPEAHKEELKNSVLRTKGMMLFDAVVDGETVCRFDLPTLGGKQMFFALYHETELFSLRVNFVGRIVNADEITEKILASFHFKDFLPRFTSQGVDSLLKVFTYNRDKLRASWGESQQSLASAEAAAELSQDYANALYGCFNVLDEEMQKILTWDISPLDLDRLAALGRDFAADLTFTLSFGGQDFRVDLGEEIKARVARWVK